MFSKHEYVYTIYKEGSFTRAAKKLFISQPSLSAAIINIENKIGGELFERNRGNIKLTEIGKEYIAATEKIMSAEKDFENRINDVFALMHGEITVGGTNYLCSYVLPRIINRFLYLHPHIKVNLVEENSRTLDEKIKKMEMDIIIDSFDEIPDEYTGYPLLDEKILLCVPENRKINNELKKYAITPESIYNESINLNDMPAVSVEQFKNEKFVILKNGNDMHKRAVRIFERSGINPEIAFSVDQLSISNALAETGMGVCFSTDTFFKYGKYNKNVVLYNVLSEDSKRTLYIAYKKGRYITKSMEEFVNVARDIIK